MNIYIYQYNGNESLKTLLNTILNFMILNSGYFLFFKTLYINNISNSPYNNKSHFVLYVLCPLYNRKTLNGNRNHFETVEI